MREFENRQKIRRKLYSLPALAVLLLITLALSRGAYSLLVKERESAKEAENLALKLDALKDREKVLSEETVKLKTEAGIEEEIKSKFNVARAGEHVAVLVDSTPNATSSGEENQSWWMRMWNAIMHKSK